MYPVARRVCSDAHERASSPDFLARLAHDLAGTHTVISMWISLFRSDPSIGLPVRDQAFDAIERALESQRQILVELNVFRQLSRTRLHVQLADTDPSCLIEDLILEARRDLAGRNISLLVGVQANLPHLQVDPVLIRQALDTLLARAMHVTSERGCIQLDVYRDGEWVCYRIRDGGPDLEPLQVATIFEPLDLMLARCIVEAHGGSLTLLEGGAGQETSLLMQIPHRDPGRSAASLRST